MGPQSNFHFSTRFLVSNLWSLQWYIAVPGLVRINRKGTNSNVLNRRAQHENPKVVFTSLKPAICGCSCESSNQAPKKAKNVRNHSHNAHKEPVNRWPHLVLVDADQMLSSNSRDLSDLRPDSVLTSTATPRLGIKPDAGQGSRDRRPLHVP